MNGVSPTVGVRSWGLPGPFPHRVIDPAWRDDLRLPAGGEWLPHGNSRSYGDVALNSAGALVRTRWLDRYLAFDAERGVLSCEAGVQLSSIVRDFLPLGWFPAVVPGTRFVTVGGAIANDVHGKNHHRAGTFGEHVEALTLQRSDGTRIDCARTSASDWLSATIGGLGLTGLITTARLRLRRVSSGWMNVSTRRFKGLGQFFELNELAEREHEYTVAWIDCLSAADQVRGVFFAGDHAEAAAGRQNVFPPEPRAHSWPVRLPFSLVNGATLRVFNALYYAAAREGTGLQPLWQYFWPLDAIEGWNRLYGRRGLLQYQFVVPVDRAPAVISQVLRRTRRAGLGSFLAVLKTFGNRLPSGMLSFVRPGVTLALDFPQTPAARELLQDLDAAVLDAGGALYPAKDAVGSARLFRAAYPAWDAFRQFRDPNIDSDFARRMEAR